MGNNIDSNSSSNTSKHSSSNNIIKANVPSMKSKKNGVASKNSKGSINGDRRTMGSRQGEKRRKIVMNSKESNIAKDLNNEYNVLEIFKKNNHDDSDHELIEKCLLNHFFMRSLERQARNEIIKEMTLCKVKPNEAIFKQGTIGNFFYIIKEGDVDLLIDEKKIKTLKSGE